MIPRCTKRHAIRAYYLCKEEANARILLMRAGSTEEIYLPFFEVRTFCVIVVLGCLFAVLGLMKRPVIDDLLTVLVLLFCAIVRFSYQKRYFIFTKYIIPV